MVFACFTIIRMSKEYFRYGAFILIFLVAVFAFAAPSATQPADVLALSLPARTWSIEVASPGFSAEDIELAPNGKAIRLMASNRQTGVIVSIFLEPARRVGDAKACREFFWNRAKQSPFPKEQIRQYEDGDMAIVEYVVPGFGGQISAQRNVNAYLSQDGCWIDVHLSSVGPIDKTAEAMSAVTKTIRINKAATPNALLLFEFGKNAYERNQYPAVISHFAKALELEKQTRTLDSARWKEMLNLLGMSYGISGDIVKARQTLQYAISQEPDYPLFYYNMACACAESNDRNGALANLKLAYQHKNGLLKGETLPNPSEDTSFEKLLRNKSFADAVKKLSTR